MKKSPFVITVSGDPLAGKTSAIDKLVPKYEEKGFIVGEREEGRCIIRLAAGGMFRDIALQSGIEAPEGALKYLSDFAKKPGNTMRELKSLSPNPEFLANLNDEMLDKSLDVFIDEYMLTHTEMLKAKYAGKEDVIIILDSRIAGLLMKNMGMDNMAVRFSIKPEIAAQRLVKAAKDKNRKGEINIDGLTPVEAFNEAFDRTLQRTANERERFIKSYSKDIFNQAENAKADIQNLDNYDLIIDTSGTTIDREIEVFYTCIENARQGRPFDKFWRSTKYILPGSPVKKELDSKEPPRISALKIDGQFYALEGQEYVGIANHKGYLTEQETGLESDYPLIPIDLVAKDDQFIFAVNNDGNLKGSPADLYVKHNITKSLVEAFEHDYGFKYPEKGVVHFRARDEKKHSGPIR